jgi:uncharacterized protein YozE (UPF0346 family)
MDLAQQCAEVTYQRIGFPKNVDDLFHMLRCAYLEGRVVGMEKMQTIYSPVPKEEK